MLRVQLSSVHLGPWLFRQTPHNDGIWRDMSFQFEATDADWLVVFDAPPAGLETRLAKERRLLVICEPPEVRRFSSDYLNQFGCVLSSYDIPSYDRDGARPRCVVRPSCLPWFYGRQIGAMTGHHSEGAPDLLWEGLIAPPPTMAERDIEISAICSKKTVTGQQVRRLRFLHLLKRTLGERLQIFGRGFHPIDDKSEIIRRSRYHLALENSQSGLFWSEKLADPILGGAYPIHAGAESTKDLFNPAALLQLDLAKPREAIRNVEALLDQNPAASEDVIQAMADNRERVLHQLNFFAELYHVISTWERAIGQTLTSHEPVIINPPAKSGRDRIKSSLKGFRRLIWQLQITLLERA